MSIEIYMLVPKVGAVAGVPGIHKIEKDSDFDAKEGKFIKLESFSQGLPRAVAPIRPSAVPGGTRASPVEHGHLVVSRNFDASSMQLMKAHVGGLMLGVVHIFGCRTLNDAATKSRKPIPLIHVLMADVVIANYQYSVGGESAAETLELRYTSIGWRLRSVKRGSAVDKVSSWGDSACWWDGKKNTATQDTVAFTDAMLNADTLFKTAGFDNK